MIGIFVTEISLATTPPILALTETEMSRSRTIGGAADSADGNMLRFEIITDNGMTGIGGPATTTESSLSAEAGTSRMEDTGIRHGVTLRTLIIRTMVRSMVTAT